MGVETIAAGQLGSSAAQIAAPGRVRVCAQFHNTSLNDQVVTITLLPAGGTARVLAYVAQLQTRETLVIDGVRLDERDVIQGVATEASVVEYLVSQTDPGPRNIYVLDANGARKGSADLLEQMLEALHA